MTAPSTPRAGAAHRAGAGLHAALSRRGLRTRIAVLAAVAVGVTVALASIVSFFVVRYEINHNVDRNLEKRATAVARSDLPVTLIRAAGPDSALPSPIIQQLVALGADVRVSVLNEAGKIDVGPRGNPGAPTGDAELSVAAGRSSLSIRSVSAGGVTYRVVAVADPNLPGTAVVLAQSLTETNRELGRVALVMVIVGVAGIAIAALSGLTIARTGLRPVDRITAAAEHIARTGDLRPIPVSGDDELARLTHSFNSMLLALGESRERQRQLVADAGHELRTPLTSLRTNLDLLAQASAPGARSLDPADHESLLGDVRAQLRELTGLVRDLVELART
ncbi:MAG: HAMP domain-containing protein, partial [Mycobacteriales bacterium]